MKLNLSLSALLLVFPPVAALGGTQPEGKVPLQGQAAPSAGPRLRVGVGVQWRSIDSLSLHATPRADLRRFGRFVDASASQRPANGSAGVAEVHLYDDGFVRPDAGTAADGGTWWWGYERSGQISGDNLVYSARGSVTTSSTSSAYSELEHHSDDDRIGPVIEIGADWTVSPSLEAGVDFSFSWFDLSDRQQQPVAMLQQRAVRSRIVETDSYALDGIVPPAAPYAGTLDGPGPVIDARPSRSSRATVIERQEAILMSVAGVAFEANIWNLSLGPSLQWKSDRLSVRAGAALELDVIDWEQTTTETVTVHSHGKRRQLRQWSRTSSGTAVQPGLGLGIALRWQLTRRCDASAFVKWRTMDELDVHSGRTSFTLDTSGFSGGVGLGFRL